MLNFVTTRYLLHESTRRVMRLGALTAAWLHLAFIPLFTWWHIPALALLNLLSVSAHSYAFWEARRGGRLHVAGIAMALEVGLHAIAATLALGWSSGFHYLILPMLLVVLVSGSRQMAYRLGLALGLTGIYLALKVWSLHSSPAHAAPHPASLAMLEMVCIAIALLTFIALALRFHYLIHSAQAKLERDAFTDPLTGALNRRRLHTLAQQWPPDQHHGLLMADLDHFKHINDRHGHDAGDAVLQAFGQLLQRNTRSTDAVCRWGGEEFVVLLPSTDIAATQALAQRLCDQWAHTLIAVDHATSLQATATFGTTIWQPSELLQAAIKRADMALYAGKVAGRNRVVAQAPLANGGSALPSIPAGHQP